MTISINTNTPAQIAAQDLTSNPNSQTATGAPAGAPASAVDEAAASSPSDQITAHAGLVALANSTLQGAPGGLVNPDLNGEGARLQALQLQQQLSTQTVSIANQAPQALLALLR